MSTFVSTGKALPSMFEVTSPTRRGSFDGSDGFKPLRKSYSEPVRGLMDAAFTQRTSSKKFLQVWNEKDWAPIQKRGSFGHKSIAEKEAAAAITQKTDATPTHQTPLNPPATRQFTPAIIVVDPFSSGALLANAAINRGYHCIRVNSENTSPVADLVQAGMSTQYDATVQFDSDEPDAAKALADVLAQVQALPWKVCAVLPGAETGVLLADQLAAAMSVRTNPIHLSAARRNKWIMGETIRKAGVRAVKQTIAGSWGEAVEFLREWNPSPYKVIVKPNQSAGSDDVFLCTSEDEVKKGFDKINGAINGLGVVNEGVLLQEFLEGKEYVVDSVSRDGESKITAIWEYDKREVNGQFNVYFGMQLLAVNDDLTRQLVEYQRNVLTALEIVNGPAHAEIMMTKTGPCLVEVGSRCHGGEGTWQPIANGCVGYNQIDVTLDAYLEEGRFMCLPDAPTSLAMSGREAFIVAKQSGVLRECPGFAKIKLMESYLRGEEMIHPGMFMAKTIDCFTRPAAFQLLHSDPAVVEADYLRIRALEENGMWDFSVLCATQPAVGAIVVVDPFSSGAMLASRIVELGYKLVMLFSEVDSPVASLVQSGTSLSGEVVQHENLAATDSDAFDETCRKLEALDYPILAILPGAETGVLLADQLAEKFGTRTNPLYLSTARRNKYVMGETIRKAGVRAVKQTIARHWSEAAKFLKEWNPSPYKVIVKPNQSAGSDDVFLCTSEDEVKKGFDKINGAINGLGVVNEGVLLQECLMGKEYVVDSVSRDGESKITAIWEYDKREVNGQFNVYFGMELKAVDSGLGEELVAYQKSVLDALEIVNGPAHAEIMMTPTGPCLVEVGSRCHGGEGTWQPLADGCMNMNQINATVDAYLRPDVFDKLPNKKSSLNRFGREVFLVARENGRIKSIPGIDVIMKLESFIKCEMAVQVGDELRQTVDCFTRPGAIQLLHDDKAVVERDYARIRELELDGMFELY